MKEQGMTGAPINPS